MRDIGERRLAEDALRKSHVMPTVLFRWKPDDRPAAAWPIVYVSIFGYDAEDLTARRAFPPRRLRVHTLRHEAALF